MLTINILAIVNVFIIFALLFFRRENALPNKILAIAFLIPGLYFINTIFILAGFSTMVPISLFFVQMIAVLFPVALYYYFSLLQGKGFRINKTLFTGSGFLFIYIVVLTIHFISLTKTEQTAYILSLSTENYPQYLLLYTIFFYTWQLVYFSVITWEIIKYKKQLDTNLSNLEQSQFYYMVRFILVLWFFNLLLVALYITLPLYIVDYLLLPIVVNVLYLFIIYFSFHHNAIFTSTSFNKLGKVNDELNECNDFSYEKKNFIPSEKHQLIYQALVKLIEEDLIYNDPDISVKMISKKIGELEYLISQSINYYYKKSFFDLINENRVREAKVRLLKMQPTETIEGIAIETGFNSRSSFYRAFKKYTEKTPQQFINSSK